MFGELIAATESVKNLGLLLKAAHGLSNYNEIVAAVSEVNAKLMEANAVALASQEKQFALADAVAKLENKLREIEDWKGEAERYVLNELSPGLFAYTVKKGMERGEPPHHLCANCMTKREKSILQKHGRRYECHRCKSVVIEPANS
jgi:ribosomal protein S27AE